MASVFSDTDMSATLSTVEKDASLLAVIHQSVGMRRHIEVFLWLNGGVQQFLPHEILIVAWGNFDAGDLLFDIISPIPGVRTHRLASEHMIPFVSRLFHGWHERGGAPFILESADGFALGEEALECLPIRAVKRMRSAVVHGIKDLRGKHDCLYVSLAESPPENGERVRRAMEILMPHLDMALRRLHHVESQLAPKSPAVIDSKADITVSDEISDLGLSSRQLEIMAWVRAGKTNQEIGQILEISMFTVKNHLQRVFKKLDVLNRAQAVALMSPSRRESGSRAHV